MVSPIQKIELPIFKKILIIIPFLLVTFAYLPTLTSDYATQDQWRAFRYSISPESPSYRLKACVKMIPAFYISTGRPLVWSTECLEHAWVSTIGDFRSLRPFVFFILLMSVACLGTILGRVFGDLLSGITAASLFVMTPSYAFMYMQGMTAGALLLCPIFAGLSFMFFRQWLDLLDHERKKKIHLVIKSSALFLIACMFYPVWAFIVIPLSMLHFGLSKNESFQQRTSQLGLSAGFFAALSVLYYLLVRLFIVIAGIQGSDRMLTDGRQVRMMLRIPELLGKANMAISRLTDTPPFNFHTPRMVSCIVLILFSVLIVQRVFPRIRKHKTILAAGLALSAFNVILLVFSLSPWLFSPMAYLASRWLVPWSFFLCGAVIGIIWLLFDSFFPRIKKTRPHALMLILLFISAFAQYRLSSAEVTVFQKETGALWASINAWLDRKGFLDQRYLLIVRPQKFRPASPDPVGGKFLEFDDNAVLASSQNPVSIPWMITAVLREIPGHPIGKEMGYIFCGPDQACAEWGLSQQGVIVIGWADHDTCVDGRNNPHIINLSLLTDSPVTPDIRDGCAMP